jgi:hypothetical protein
VAILAGPEEGEGASSETEGCRIRLTDLNTGETRELTHEAGTSYRFKLGTDALILCWEEENADGEAVSYLAKLNADGSVSETCLADSKEGRALTVTKEDTFPFCGEEAYLESGAIWSMEDGKMLLGGVRNVFGGLNGSYIGLVPAPDGSSVCIYNQGLVKESVPFVIRFSDLDTLVQKAKAKLKELEG